MTNRPVIIGVGEFRDRPADLLGGLDPVGMMAAAARIAEADVGASLLHAVDSVEVVHQISWRYHDTARRVCDRLGIAPKGATYHPGGGESPLRVLHDTAARIASGETCIALICGGEARSTQQKARRQGVALNWPPRANEMEHPWRVDEMLSSMPRAHGVAQPTFIYPFYENATLAAWGQSPSEAQHCSARLWHLYSQSAAENPSAWSNRVFSSEEIARVTDDNPLIAWPYTRLMVANPTVNLGAAVLVTNEETAFALGIAPERLVYIVGGAASKEPDDYLQRDSYHSSPSQEVVLRAASDLTEGAGFKAIELYSCFPCVPKMAIKTLGLDEGIAPTVTGGLTFFGGPFNSYMLHAACAMTRQMRAGQGFGLLYGQGDFVTKHHAIVLSSLPGRSLVTPDYRVDKQAALIRGPIPAITEIAIGPAKLETFTVLYGRHNQVERGVAIIRLPDGRRSMARVPASDHTTIASLTSEAQTPIGSTGLVAPADDGLLEWRI